PEGRLEAAPRVEARQIPLDPSHERPTELSSRSDRELLLPRVATGRAGELRPGEGSARDLRHAAEPERPIEAVGGDLRVEVRGREALLGLEIARRPILERDLEAEAAPAATPLDPGRG